MKRTAIIIAALVGIFGIVYFASVFNLYPVASVNGEMIWAGDMQKHFDAAYHYYEKASRNASAAEKEKLIDPKFIVELRRVSLDTLIENKVVEAGFLTLGKQGEEDLSKMIGNTTSSQALAPAINELYGLMPGDFTRLILVPQAQRNILSSSLILQKVSLNDWILQKRKAADVSIFLASYQWQDGELITR